MNITTHKVIAIDGREASGKGEASKRVARRLGFDRLDSGSIYRTVALLVKREKLHEWQIEEICTLVDREIHRLSISDGKVCLDGILVGDEIRTKEIANFTPLISPIPHLRKRLVPLQRACVTDRGLVAEGRDMTSVIFPDAALKIFLTASDEVRAERRLEQYRQNNEPATFTEVLADQRVRDRRDETRPDSPLIRVPDAVEIDTGKLDKQQVEDLIVELWNKRS